MKTIILCFILSSCCLWEISHVAAFIVPNGPFRGTKYGAAERSTSTFSWDNSLVGARSARRRQPFIQQVTTKNDDEIAANFPNAEKQDCTISPFVALSKACRSITASIMMSGLLTFYPMMSLPATVSDTIHTHPDALWSLERPADIFPTTKLQRTMIPPAYSIFGVSPASAADGGDISSTFMSKLNEEIPLDANDELLMQLRLKRSTVLDEVWTLVNKYYVDNTYNSQDWYKVRDTYESRLVVRPDGSYDDEEAMKLAITMVRSLGDKYSRILDRDAYARIQKFDLIGVGATLMPDSEKRIMVGAPPIKGSEAEKAGIKYGDYVVAVNGRETTGRTAFDIIDQIAENPDADVVTMTVLTQGPNDLKGEGYKRDVTMKRQFVQVNNPVIYKISERRNDGTVVGYIRISEFNSLVKSKLEKALTSLKEEGANAFVMDLRGNPGGAFQSAVEIAGLFLDGKVATNVVDANQVEMPFLTTKGRSLLDDNVPLVIWQDGRSASASEVLAGALHDQCRAVVMGSNSFGKGLIQAVYGLKNGSGLVLTVARYVTPAGTDIQGRGITPDIEAKLPTPLIVGLSTDTSKVDFQEVAMKRNSCLCPLSSP